MRTPFAFDRPRHILVLVVDRVLTGESYHFSKHPKTFALKLCVVVQQLAHSVLNQISPYLLIKLKLAQEFLLRPHILLSHPLTKAVLKLAPVSDLPISELPIAMHLVIFPLTFVGRPIKVDDLPETMLDSVLHIPNILVVMAW